MHANMLQHLGLTSKKSGHKHISKKQVIVQEDDNEGDGFQEQAGDGKLTLGDLFTSIDKSKMGSAGKDDVINTNRLQK